MPSDERSGRREPYTERGIRRLKCVRCGAQAEFQWQICADGNLWRPICRYCDRRLNRKVLEWMGFGAAEVTSRMNRYRGDR